MKYRIHKKNEIPIAGRKNIDEFEHHLDLYDPKLKHQIAEGYSAYRRGEIKEARVFLDELKAKQSPRNKRKSKKT